MCFGSDSTKTTNSSSTVTPPSWLSDAAKSNINFAQGVQNKGFTPYSGDQVASFAPQQSDSFNLGANVAGGVAPYVGETGSLIDNYAKAGPQRVSADTIASRMSPYMSSYVADSLAPQIQAQDLQFANQNKGVDAAATSAGAFGDTGWGQMRGTTTQAQDAARTGLVGNAYNAAFNTAIGAGAQDVANDMNAKTTNANLAETALGRQLTGANAIYQMGTGATTLDNTLGGQQTAQEQAQKNADYNQWLMGQQYPFQTTQLMDQAVAAGRAGAPISTTGTSTETQPDNSGFGILGSIAGSALRFVADGGDVQDGQPTVVGERGPELIVPQGSGVVIPNEVLQAAKMLRDQKVANGQGDPASSLQEALKKPVRYMADGGFFGDAGFGGPDMSAADPSQSAMMNPDPNSNIIAFPTPTAAPIAQPGQVGSDLNGTGTPRVFASPQDQAMLAKVGNGANGLTAPEANSVYDAYKRVGGGTDVSASVAARQPPSPAMKGLADTLSAQKTWAGLNRPATAAPAQPSNLNLAQMPMPAMAPISLPGGGTSMMPQNMTAAPGAPAAMKFGIAA